MRRPSNTQISAATAGRDFRTFLLMSQFEAKEIGARIAQARREAGLTQQQLAELAPFSARSLQDYETGVTIPYRQLREIGKLLDRPIEWFLHGETEDKAGAIAELRAHLDERFDELERLIELAIPAEDRSAARSPREAARAAAEDADRARAALEESRRRTQETG